MYSMADVIYGIPITRRMDRWLQEHMDDEDVQTEEFEELGFCVQYSGNADHQCGFLGELLAGMDVINPVEMLRDSKGRIIALRVSTNALATSTKDFDLCPTSEQVEKTLADYNKLPEGLKEVAPKPGIYIVWSTS